MMHLYFKTQYFQGDANQLYCREMFYVLKVLGIKMY